MTKIALIINDISLLKRLQDILHLQPGIVCIAAVASLTGFWEKLPKSRQADIIFVDGNLPENSSLKSVSALRKHFPKAEIVLLIDSEDGQEFIQALQNGATGLLKKGFPEFSLPKLIRTIQNGGALLSPTIARKLVAHFNSTHKKLEILSPSEEQLLRLFYEGKSYRDSASLIGISVDGVKYHVKNIYRKLEVHKKVDALRIYREHVERDN